MRPTDYKNPDPPETEGICPFCYGNESETPAEIFSIRNPGTKKDKPGWKTRVFRNKFPALTGSPIDNKTNSPDHGIIIPGFGKHEVIVENPKHDADFPDMSVEDIESVLDTYLHRLNEYGKDSSYKYILIFRNFGYYAGATFSHPHSQLIATPLLPSTIEVEQQAAKEYYQQTVRCWFCDSINGDLNDSNRIIYCHGNIIAYSPFAPRLPYEFNITSGNHSPVFNQLKKEDMNSLAIVLKHSITKLKDLFPDISYNCLLHTMPESSLEQDREKSAYNHWHLEILPRLVKTAGFEIGAGFSINPTLPEQAAEMLRTG